MKRTFTKENFNIDEEFGKWGEQIVSLYIQYTSKKHKVVLVESNNSKKLNELKKWDLKFNTYEFGSIYPKTQFLVEVKTDKYIHDTGNLVFEKTCNKKKSGVFATESKYFVYFLPKTSKDNIWMIESVKLINLLEKWNTHLITGGDGNSAWLYQINKNEFKQHFIEAGGKVDSWNEYIIPEKFNIKMFDNKCNFCIQADKMKEYKDDIFDF